MIVANEFQVLKLGKGVAFVKSKLRRLRQEDDVWEAEFLPIPCLEAERPSEWLGMVISHTDDYLLAQQVVNASPTSWAMRRIYSNGLERMRAVVENLTKRAR
jgi:hypothetical protein